MPVPNLLEKNPIFITTPYYVKQLSLEQSFFDSITAAGITDFDEIKCQFLVFDLSGSYWYDLGVLLWFVSLLNKLKKQGNDIQLVFPDPSEKAGASLWDFLLRWRFFETLSACVDDAVNLLRPQQVPFLNRKAKYGFVITKDQFGDATFLHSLKILEITTIKPYKDKDHDDMVAKFLLRYNDKIIYSALSSLCGWDYSLTKSFVQRVIREGIQNTFLHSNGSFSNISMRIDNKNLTVVISDNGIGIPSVLRNAFKESKHTGFRDKVNQSDAELIKFFTDPEMVLDSKLIKMSVQKGTSSKPERQGLGLYYLKSIVTGNGGELRIRSGKACIDFKEKSEKVNDNVMLSPGTMLRIQTPLK